MADPYPKSRQLARGERRYRRKIASPKQWQAIIAAKGDLCRVCESMGRAITFGHVEYHHLVARAHRGDDVAANIVPLCSYHHSAITVCSEPQVDALLSNLTDTEYAYMIQRGGEDYPERAYGIRYTR
jgi:hypothetical protein